MSLEGAPALLVHSATLLMVAFVVASVCVAVAGVAGAAARRRRLRPIRAVVAATSAAGDLLVLTASPVQADRRLKRRWLRTLVAPSTGSNCSKVPHGWVHVRHGHDVFDLQSLSETELLRSWVSGDWVEPTADWECHGTGQRRPRRPLHRRQLRGACDRHGFRRLF